MPHDQSRLMSYIVVGVLAGGMMIWRMQRMQSDRRLRLEFLWVLPAILLALAALLLVQAPPAGLGWLWLGVALAAGAALGWVRGSMMRISIDPGTHALNTRASPAAILFVLVLLAARFALRTTLADHAAAWRISAALVTDVFMAFAVGLIGVQRLEMAIRARRLLSEARRNGETPA